MVHRRGWAGWAAGAGLAWAGLGWPGLAWAGWAAHLKTCRWCALFFATSWLSWAGWAGLRWGGLGSRRTRPKKTRIEIHTISIFPVLEGLGLRDLV